jgi:hypothetical protein
MSNSQFLFNLIQCALCGIMAGAVYAETPVVKPTCTISWDRSAGIAEYHLTIWKIIDSKPTDKATHIVKAPSTQVSCQEVGANKPGKWQVTIQACLKDGTCSEPSKSMSFKVAEK